MMLIVYGIKHCGSVKKARAYLESKGLIYEFIDLKQTPIEAHVLDYCIRAVGIKTLLNTKSATYKALETPPTSIASQRQAMLMYPLMIKRPVIIYKHDANSKEQVLVGFDIARFDEVFSK